MLLIAFSCTVLAMYIWLTDTTDNYIHEHIW